MKKHLYLLSAVLIIFLTSFVILKSPLKKEQELWGSCSKPNSLTAIKNYNQITFNWSNTGSDPSNVGGGTIIMIVPDREPGTFSY